MTTAGERSRGSSDGSDDARQAAESGGEKLETLGKIGYAAYGAVHVVLAILIVRLALGGGSGETSTSGALSTVAQQPFGQVLLWVIALGMALLALWQQAEAALDGSDGATGRVKHAGKAVAYGVVAFVALRVVLGSGSSGGSSGGQRAAGFLFSLPGGRFLVGLLGLGVLVVAGYHVYKGVSKKYLENLNLSELPDRTRRVVDVSGRVGYPAKGVAYGIVGLLFLVAAVQRDSSDAGGLDQALQTLRDQPFGPYLLLLVGLGFGLFAIFCFGRARTSPE